MITMTKRWTSLGGVVLTAAGVMSGCTKSSTAAASTASPLQPIVSVKELMQNIVDPQADYVFDAVAVDVGEKGTVETAPTTDEDWEKVQRGAVILAEATNLLKMPRRIAPVGDTKNSTGAGAPELPPEEIQKKVDGDRALWNSHADTLKAEALKVLDIVKHRQADKLFEAGSNIDRACESCHLEYWYPGDKAAVLKDQNSRAFFTKPPAR